MKLVVIGAGNIGLVTAAAFAEVGHSVLCVDNNQAKIEKLKQAKPPFAELGLDELLQALLKEEKISFTHQIEKAFSYADIFIIAVGTPNTNNGHIDLQSVDSVIEAIATDSTPANLKTIIIRSTVPPGTNQKYSKKYPHLNFISNPEFLREGSALADSFKPERIIIGTDSIKQFDLVKEIYKNFQLTPEKFIQMDPSSAEMTKYAANIFLAARISLINEISRVCEKTGANILEVQKGIGLDSRIGSQFLNAGIGYGGSCFPKDLEAFIALGTSLDENLHMSRAIKETNDLQMNSFFKKIKKYFLNQKEKTIAIWGASFKPETDDLRAAPALKLVELLRQENFKIKIYDPFATSALKQLFANDSQIIVCSDKNQAAHGAPAVAILTEWTEFKDCDLTQLKNSLSNATVFDGRNIFDPNVMKKIGFDYYSIGRA